jgi:hypothetical protein
MDRSDVKPLGGRPPMQVLLERAALGLGRPGDALAARAQRVQAERAWREGVMAKVREGRWEDLAPEERGLILLALATGCPDA